MSEVVLETLRITRRFEASAERVFDAWLNPKVAARWLFTSPGSESHTTELDVRVGGQWKIVDRRDGTDFTALGEYRVIDRPRRLVFSFGMPQFSPVLLDVVIEIEPDGDGCVMTLIQGGMHPDHVKPSADGWNVMFDAMGALLAAG